MAVKPTRNQKQQAVKRVQQKKPVVRKNEPVQNIIDVEVDDEEQTPIFEDVKPVVNHSYDENTGHFTAEKDDGENMDMFVPSVLTSDYCVIAKKFVDVYNGVSIGRYSAGTYKTIDYDEMGKLDDTSLESVHCYNIISEHGVEMLEKVLTKLKRGGRCFIVDEKCDLRTILNTVDGIGIRFCDYGYRLFNHHYWFSHKNMSIALIMKG